MNEQAKHNPSDESKKVAATEAEYLQNQVNEASAAISGAFAAFKADLMKGADPRAWAHQYPWVAVGAAAVAGFAAASAMVPSKEEQAIKKLERIERALRPEPAPAGPHPGHAAGQPGRESKSLAGRLFSEVFSALKPALSSALAAYAAGNATNGDGDGPSGGNGHSAASGGAAGNAAYYQQESDPDRA